MSTPKKKKDRHKHSALILRLPPVYRTQLKKQAEKHRRTLTEQAKIAFEESLAKDGFWPPVIPIASPASDDSET